MIFGAHAYAANPVAATYYAAPDGSGNAGTTAAPCSLTGVRDLVRTVNQNMKGDIVVNLRGGLYTLKEPLQLVESADLHDSGTNGFNIIYQAATGETPVISGGIEIKGWTVFDHDKNIYRAKIPEGVQSRQLYVDDCRAIRARGPLKPLGWTKTATGWTITDESMQNWRNPSEIEIVSRSSWKHLRCDIATITGTEVTMKTPGWTNCAKTPHPGNPFNGGGTQQMNTVEWVENAFELLQTPGQWYLDDKEGYLYYIPKENQDMNSVSVVLPVLETLLDVHGTSATQKVHNIQFVRLTFKHATWMQPSGDQGYADNQAGVAWVNVPPVSSKTPGNLSFQYASDIRLEKNVVAHMGGCAIDFGHAPQKNVLIGNCIYDISGNGIFLGDVDDYATTDPQAWCDANIIQDNYITQVGVEFEDQVGICTGYARHLLVDHNELFDLPYSGISVGWGWSNMGYSHQNTITNNEVHRYMNILGDGGGIYTLGNQGTADEKTVWSGNYVHDAGHAQGLYADEGSGFMEIKNNLVTHVGANWMYMWIHTVHDIDVHDNFADKTNFRNKGTNCTLTNNDMTLKPGSMPDAAQAIAKNAGLEEAYADIKNKIPLPDEVMVNDSEPAITYTGTWTASGHRNLGDYGDDVHSTSAPGNSASLTFNGLGIDYLTEFNHDEGVVNVYIDNALVQTVDCQSPDRITQKVAYHQTWPEAGPHVIKIDNKAGSFTILDAFKVYHKLPPPAPSPKAP